MWPGSAGMERRRTKTLTSHQLHGTALSSAIARQSGVVLSCLKPSAPHLTTSRLHSSFKAFPQTRCWSLLAPGSSKVQRDKKELSLASQQGCSRTLIGRHVSSPRDGVPRCTPSQWSVSPKIIKLPMDQSGNLCLPAGEAKPSVWSVCPCSGLHSQVSLGPLETKQVVSGTSRLFLVISASQRYQ